MILKIAKSLRNAPRRGRDNAKQPGASTDRQRILAVLDGSEGTGLVIKHLLALPANQRIVEVVLLNIQPKPQEWRMRGYGWFQREAIEDRLINDLGARIVRSAGRQLDSAGMSHKERVEIGKTTETILRCAAEEDCDLILLAEPRPGPIRRWLLRTTGISMGSAASALIHLASSPVLVAK